MSLKIRKRNFTPLWEYVDEHRPFTWSIAYTGNKQGITTSLCRPLSNETKQPPHSFQEISYHTRFFRITNEKNSYRQNLDKIGANSSEVLQFSSTYSQSLRSYKSWNFKRFRKANSRAHNHRAVAVRNSWTTVPEVVNFYFTFTRNSFCRQYCHDKSANFDSCLVFNLNNEKIVILVSKFRLKNFTLESNIFHLTKSSIVYPNRFLFPM